MEKKTIEELYQKKTPIEHILLRPETYIGPVDQHKQSMYVLENEKIVNKSITYVPGLFKIFDEILVNAADNKIRDPSMSKLVVEISNEKISVWNNGKGVPIKMHKKEQVYVPELIFGQLLTSSNYDDKEKKVTGGRNGYGAKLCNIFSKEFIIETADQSENRTYYQRYSKNMSIREDPITKKERIGDSYTRITFVPDLKRFGMTELDEETISLLKKRVYDMCATIKKVKVFLNGSEIPVKSFKEYVQLYIPDNSKMVHLICNERWEIAVLPSDDQLQQISFVNSICTIKGGTHVTHVLDQLIEPIIDKLSKKEKNVLIKPIFVKNSIFLFVNCLIENPSFDSQTKETLTLRVSSFGSNCGKIKEKIIKEILNLIADNILQQARQKQRNQLKKTDGAKKSKIAVEKLDDANKAGTKDSCKCSLILTEGDSAKTFAISGVETLRNGRDFYGVFPLRGKLVNVRDAPHDKIMKNEEISNIKKILGLQHSKDYTSTDSLRYGSVVIMTDQDHDGSHIKGLLINFFEHYFPSLLRLNGFLKEFITPIVKATKKRKRRANEGEIGSQTTLAAEESEMTTADDDYVPGTVLEFYTMPEYERWRASIPNFTKKWEVKYFKGLGTNTKNDAKSYFSNLEKHLKEFQPLINDDKFAMELAFSKTKADDRKIWLQTCSPETFLDHSITNIPIRDFINKELILFSMADNIRSIPSMVDGFKPGQRKVLHICLKNNINSTLKVAQLSGKVAEQAAYHHGEMSLHQTIIKLAQNFVGSNNINLLFPDGQFGSRRQGGKDSASARYISTGLSRITRKIFKESDDPLLHYLQEDNCVIEPIFQVPIVPMVLVNGADGIGTGWLTKIHNYNLLEIIENIELMMDGKEPLRMTPWYRGFKGPIEEIDDNKYTIGGMYDLEYDEFNVTEIPVRVWSENYKEMLETKRGNNEIKEFTAHHYNDNIHFKIILNSAPANIEKFFNLKTTSICSNFVCFDRHGKIKRYSNAEDILKDFYSIRLEYYNLRKQHLVKELQRIIDVLSNKVRFITEFMNGKLKIFKRKKIDVCNDLEKLDYLKVSESYDYLLDMSIVSLTLERIESLNRERNRKQEELDELLPKTDKCLWREDLRELKIEYNKFLSSFDEDDENDTNNKKMKRRKKNKMSQFSSTSVSDKNTNKKNEKNLSHFKVKQSKSNQKDNKIKKKSKDKRHSDLKGVKHEKKDANIHKSDSKKTKVETKHHKPKSKKKAAAILNFDRSSDSIDDMSHNEKQEVWRKYE